MLPEPARDALVAVLRAAGGQVGRATEQAVRAHHLLRLRRTGHLAARRPLSDLASGPFEIRAGNDIELLVDGREAFAAMLAAIAAARSTVHLTGWSTQASFALGRESSPPVTLGAALRAAGERGVRSRLLVWAGAPAPAMHPTRSDVAREAAALGSIRGARCVLDAREHALDCHHEKVLLVDEEVAFVGGLDMSGLGTDRWDVPGHPPRGTDGWHDVAVGLRGPVVADLARHFGQRWAEISGERLPPPDGAPPAGTVRVRVARTIPEGLYAFAPDGEFGVLAEYLSALRSATRLVYLENQFLWGVEVVDVLVDKLRHPPTPDFRLVVLLPDRAHTGQDATLGQLSRLVEADADGGRFLAITPLSDAAPHPVYVHAKVAVVDDRWLTVGSANLNSHSLFNDTEVNVVIDDPGAARATRERLWLEHTGVTAAGQDPTTFVDTVLGPLAREQRDRQVAGLAPTAHLSRLDHVSRRSDLLLGPLSAVVFDS